MDMEYRELGHTGYRVSVIGFGACETGLQADEELKRLVPPGATLAQVALRWILMFDAVSCAIPGARTPDQAEQNTRAADLPPLSEADMRTIQEVYDRLIRPQVHHLW